MPYLVTVYDDNIEIKTSHKKPPTAEVVQTIKINGDTVMVWEPVVQSKLYYFKYNTWFKIPKDKLPTGIAFKCVLPGEEKRKYTKALIR